MENKVRLSQVAGFVVLAVILSLSAGYAQASPATYGIDEVYDNVNGDWFSTTPTFAPGHSYDLTIVGSGESGGILGEYAQEFVSLGAFINYGEVGTDWSAFPDAPVVADSAIGLPVLSLNHTYTVNGSFIVPGDAPAGPGEALVWLDGNFLNPPDEAGDLFPTCTIDRRGHEKCCGGALAMQGFGIEVVPEPATLALLSFGMTGFLFRNRKKRA